MVNIAECNPHGMAKDSRPKAVQHTKEDGLINAVNHTSSDGDDYEEQKASRIPGRVQRMTQPIGTYSFNKFRGTPGENPRVFMAQFKPYRAVWDEETTLAHIETNLEGKASKWYRCAKDDIFKTLEEFEAKFDKKFNKGNSMSALEKLFSRLEGFRLKQGQIQEGLMEIVPLQKETTIGMDTVIRMISGQLPSEAVRRLQSQHTTEALLDEAEKLDEDYGKDQTRYRGRASNVAEGRKAGQPYAGKSEKRQQQKGPAGRPERPVPSDIKCYNCKGNHYATACPEKQSLKIMAVASTLKKPMVKVGVRGRTYLMLLDTGATTNFMDKKLAERIGFASRPGSERVVLGLGEAGSTCGSTSVRIRSEDGKNALEAEFLIAEGISEGFILGYPTMMDLNISIGRGEDTVGVFNGEAMKLVTEGHRLHAMTMQAEDSETEEENGKRRCCLARFGDDADLNSEVKAIISRTGVLTACKKNEILEIEHTIELEDGAKPPYSRPYRRSLQQNEVITAEVRKLMDEEMIRESASPFASPVVLVRKKDGSMRFCVDYRKLNDITVQKPFPIPHMEEALESVSGARIFSALDLESGYHQIKISEPDREKTAFITRDGLFEWNRMPFGLINAPYTFQRIMNHVFREMLWTSVIVYMDDILIFSQNEKDHVRDVERVLSRIAEYGFKIKEEKCTFGVKKIDFLGFSIENSCIAITDEQRNKARLLEVPKNVSELRSILGFATFFRRFIPRYVEKVDPLLQRLKRGNFAFGEAEKQCLRALQDEIREAKPLVLPNMRGTFILYTDASGWIIAAALTQMVDGCEMSVTYIGRKLTSAELNYTVTEKECLAIVWAVRKLRVYLANEFIIRTDHSALTWLLKQKEPRERIARWIMELQGSKYKIEHIAGHENVIADALSRGVVRWEDPGDAELKMMKAVSETEEERQSKEERTLRIASAHEEVGHGGVESTYTYLKSKNVGWRNMWADVKEFTRRCDICCRHRDRAKGNVQMRVELKDPFFRIGIDLVGPLPKSANGNRYLIVATDHLTRWAEVRAVKKKTAAEVGAFIYEEIILRHGAPCVVLNGPGPGVQQRVHQEDMRDCGGGEVLRIGIQPTVQRSC